MIGKTNEVSNTLTTELAHSTGRDFFRSGQGERIFNSCGIFRRLTPKECFRLQGFLNDEIDLTGLSDTQAYKLAGNGQSVNVVAKIFERMFKNEKEI
jgi:site-specific DNA-cytosine methylase